MGIAMDFIVDKLTNSIENMVTGDSFPTAVIVLAQKELPAVSKRKGWQFDWKVEMKNPAREIYKLTIVGNPNIVQGLMSLEVKQDHVYMHLLESAPFNKGTSKMYAGVAANLVAFACQLSFQRGHEGYVSFTSKSALVEHYQQTLGARHAGNRLMIIETPEALKLTNKYFKT